MKSNSRLLRKPTAHRHRKTSPRPAHRHSASPVFRPRRREVSIVLLVVSMALFFFMSYVYNKNAFVPEKREGKFPIIRTPTPTPTIEITNDGCTEIMPQKNSLYIGIDKENPNKKILFHTYDTNNTRYVNGIRTTSICSGSVYKIGTGAGSETIYFNRLENPKLLISFGGEPFDLIRTSGSESGAIEYASFVVYETSGGRIASVYKFTDNGSRYEQVWLYDLQSKTYDPYHGAADITGTFSDYITLSLRVCHGCGGTPEYGTVIVNTKNKKELFLGFVGNLQYVPDRNAVTYQKMIPFRFPCVTDDPHYDCWVGEKEWTDYRPSGDILTATLP